ncbi:hypothetical protein FJV24_18790 [Acinetobacter baumannii]|uniref:hypothetical protein n=1 Tax=Acinetobacter baumannii TaxID=470 RepID=UPI0011286CD3|nr:hypothetical protein [Acinetobacter baumannii]MBJ9495477.1 hypothetical protein [Acinetobacter baumannii]MBJ9545025.1 hypothetical protein [Acinetobacter baumannii]NMR37317.1 hypothetical protein [Acinetobacter baumannii]TPU95913.1 hypothetical protein FJV24_18790 [Acinetobacter baumannii]
MDNYKIGDEVELLEDFYTRSGAEIIFKKGTIAKVIALQLYDEIHIDVNGDNRWCSPDILKLVDKKDPALISGAEALRALADGKEVEYNWLNQKSSQWMLISDELKQFSLYEILNGTTEFGAIKFRLKPQTIKLNDVEVPAPIKTGVESDSGVLVLFKNNEDRDKFLKAMGC